MLGGHIEGRDTTRGWTAFTGWITDRPRSGVHAFGQIAVVAGGGLALYLLVCSTFWALTALPFATQAVRAVVTGLVIGIYAPFSVVVTSFFIATLTRHRLAPLIAVLAIAPARVLMFMLQGQEFLVSLVMQGPFAVVELAGSTVAVALALSPLARLGAVDRWAMLKLGLTWAGVTIGVAGMLSGGHVIYVIGDELRLWNDLPIDDEIAVGLWVLFCLGLSLIPIVAGSALLRPGGFVASWLGAFSGALVYGVAALAGLVLLEGFPRMGPLQLLAWIPLPAVFMGGLAVPAGLLGAALHWLWGLAGEDYEGDR